MPTISVIVPNYNHARFLPHSLDSLFRQTRPADEIVVIDDASTDDSVAVIEKLIAGRPNVRLERNPRNIGCNATMNRGLAMARGDYVLFASADDVFVTALIARSLALLSRFPGAALCSARIDLIDEEGRSIGDIHDPSPLGQEGYLNPAACVRHLMRDDAWFAGPTNIFDRGKLAAVGGFPERLGAIADGYVARVLSARHGACYIPAILAHWRRMEGGMASVQSTFLTGGPAVQEALALMQGPHRDVFPAGYAERWRKRNEFGARRLHLKARAGGGAFARARLALFTAYWFLKLRPQDAPAVLLRRLGHALKR
jgi:glycosyltransferase involved in cell wall biosynthesis